MGVILGRLTKNNIIKEDDITLLDDLDNSERIQYDNLVAVISGLLQYNFPELHKKYGSKMSGDLFVYNVLLAWYGKEHRDGIKNLKLFKSLITGKVPSHLKADLIVGVERALIKN